MMKDETILHWITLTKERRVLQQDFLLSTFNLTKTKTHGRADVEEEMDV